MGYELIRTAIDEANGIGIIELNRPDRRNALNEQLMREYVDALEELKENDAARVIVTRAQGPSFCSGLDLMELKERSKRQAVIDWGKQLTNQTVVVRMFEAVRLCPKVMIAEVRGYCLGGGLCLALTHDLVVSAASAQYGMPEIIRGSYGANVTAYLVHAGIPFKKIQAIMLTGENIDGSEAERLGLASWVVPDEDLESRTSTIAASIAMRHPGALSNSKLAVQLGRDEPLGRALFMDYLVSIRQRASHDPLDDIEGYLASQKGGTNQEYRRLDV
jgi:enoyl-CoA hydratase/carnithine racemase